MKQSDFTATGKPVASKDAARIPVIDLAGSYSDVLADRESVAAEVYQAGCDTGFFYVKNHRIARQTTQDYLELAREFFSLPLEEKRQVDISKSNCMRGYEAIAVQVLDEGTPPDLKEGFILGPDLQPTHRLVQQGVPNTGPNQWPQHPAHFKERVNTYLDGILELGAHLMSCIALSLRLPEDYFAAAIQEPYYFARLLHYPPRPQNAQARQIGAGAHKDWGMITLLLQDPVGGLEVEGPDGGWIRAPYIPDTFIINLGEMMPVLTNGLYRSSLHRVINNDSGIDRYSAPTFFDPNYYYEVKCVPTCTPEKGEAELAPRTVGEHISYMIRKTYGHAAA